MGTAVIKLPSETGAVISSSCSPKFALGMHVTLSASPVAFNRAVTNYLRQTSGISGWRERPAFSRYPCSADNDPGPVAQYPRKLKFTAATRFHWLN